MGLPTTPDEMIADLFGALLDERQPAVTTREWFTAGLLSAIRRDEPIDLALLLSNPGGGRTASLSRRLRMQKRDRFLAVALHAVALDDGVGRWDRCVRLSAEIERFTRFEWVACRYLERHPDHWPLAREMVWHALRCDVGVPGTAKGLYSTFRKRWPCSKEPAGATLLENFL